MLHGEEWQLSMTGGERDIYGACVTTSAEVTP
jgi:hypothetical protein